MNTPKMVFSKDRVYQTFSKLYPASLRASMGKLLVYAGYSCPVSLFLGPVLILSLLLSLILLLIPFSLFGFFDPFFVLYALIAFSTVHLLSYLVVYFHSEDRAARVESVLPDALQLIASNIKAGMTPFAAIRLAARPEFGPLESELNKATIHALGEGSFADSLMYMTARINSEPLRRAMGLFSTSMKSGGHLADLLEETARDLAETRALKADMIANTKTYLMFILFTVAFGAPVLLAISLHFVGMSESLKANVGSSELVSGLGMGSTDTVITIEFLTNASYAIIFLTSILASAMIGVITEGKEKYGAKYAPFIFAIGIVVFYFGRIAVGSVIGNAF